MRLKIDPVVAVQLLSCVQLWEPMDCSMPGFPVLHYLSEFAAFYSSAEAKTLFFSEYTSIILWMFTSPSSKFTC